MFSKTALIVDDSATAQAVLKRLLEQFDYRVDTEDDGSKALGYLKSKHPDIIFLDHIMPGLDGFQVLKQIKADSRTKNIPVVMYTSQAAVKYTNDAKALGAVAVLTKQVDKAELGQVLDHIIVEPSEEETTLELDDTNVDLNDSLAEFDKSNKQQKDSQEKLQAHQHDQIQQKNTDAYNKLHEQIKTLNVEMLSQQQRKRTHPLKVAVITALILLPTISSVNLKQQSERQQKDIEQLQTTVKDQNQRLLATNKVLSSAFEHESNKGTREQEWDDMAFMLETLITMLERRSDTVNPSPGKQVHEQESLAGDAALTPSTE